MNATETQLDSCFYPYIDMIAPNTKLAKKCLKNISKQISDVEELFFSCMDAVQDNLSDIVTFHPDYSSNLRPQVRFCMKKIKKKTKKFKAFREELYLGEAEKLSRLSHFLAECMINKSPVIVDVEGINEKIKEIEENHPTYIKYKFELESLQNYAQRLYEAPILPNIPEVQIVAVARELSSTVDPVTLHSVPSYLDDFMFFYISAQGFEGDFDELVKKVSSNPPFINMRPFQPFVNNFVSRFGEISSNERVVIKVAVSRFFFERFFRTNSHLYIEQPDFNKFIDKCNYMNSLSPKELFIGEKYIRKSEFEIPFKEIVANNDVLLTALDHILIATFYTYPADILQCVYSAMKCTEEYVRNVALERKYGSLDGIDMNSEEALLATDDLAFDDFFPIFAAVFSTCPMANAIAIQHLMEMIEKMVIPSTYDFAKVVFMTAVSHISEFDASMGKEPI